MMNTSISARVGAWLVSDDTGLSSTSIVAVMMGANPTEIPTHYPYDPSDLGRCLRLLELIPEWGPFMNEMRTASPEWNTLVDHWNELHTLMESECGVHWQHAKSAPRTYARMKELLRPT